MDLDRIDDIETLRAVAKSYEHSWRKAEEKLARLEARLDKLEGSDQLELQQEIDALKVQLATRDRLLFGKSSERRGRGKKRKKAIGGKQTGHGPTEQPELEVVERTHELDLADQTCPSCGGELQPWDGQSDDSEEVDVIERRVILLKHRRQKYRCKCGGCVETAPGPRKLVPGGRYSIGFTVHVGVAKYADHLPLERQVRMLRRAGLQVTSQALWDQVHALSKALAPAHQRLLAHLRSAPVVGADETRWPVQGKDGKGKAWHVWALATGDGVGYLLEDSRSGAAAAKLLDGFEGVAITDGYAVYKSLRKQGQKLRLAHCWAHVRRRFVEIEDSFPEQCEKVLGLIGELYEVEREARAGPDVLAARKSLRAERSQPIISQIHQWALGVEALGESPLRKAVEYMGSLWTGLTLFLEEPEVEVDNNAVERALRGVVVGRKNHYGSKSKRGTEAAAVLYSLIESAKVVGLGPDEYLRRAVDAAIEGAEIPLPHELVTRD